MEHTISKIPTTKLLNRRVISVTGKPQKSQFERGGAVVVTLSADLYGGGRDNTDF